MAMLDYISMGDEMISALGFENEEVIKYWSAYEKGQLFLACFIYNVWKVKNR